MFPSSARSWVEACFCRSATIAHLQKPLLADMDEQSLAACSHHIISPYFSGENVLAPLDILDATNQLQFDIQWCGTMEARRQRAGDAGLTGDQLRDAEKLVEDRADKATMYGGRWAFVLPAERGATVGDVAVDPDTERRGDRV